MNIELKDVITLDGQNEYFVAGKHIKEDNTYYYIVNMANYNDIKVVKLKIEDNLTKLVDVNDEALIKELSVKFLRQTRDLIEEFKNNINE